MVEQNNILPICRNGHRQTVSNSKFCIHCGTPFAAPTVQTPQANTNRPPNQTPANPPTTVQLPPNLVQPFQPPVNQNTPPFQNFHEQPPMQFQPQQNLQPQPPQHYIQQRPAQVIQALDCYTCGGNGQGLSEKTVICKECNWLRPLVPGYQVDASAFEWAADGKAMSALRSMKTLNSVAKTVSEKVGRRWIESAFSGVLLSEKQLPHIYAQAVRAARILGMSHIPDVYISGERSWDCLTFGSDRDSFVVIGSALAGNFQGADMLFLLAREMGHCRAGHALWKTVIRFFLGEQGHGKGVMADGIFNAILNPTALIENAIEAPLLGWARQAEITADRAGLLVVGDEEIARRVLLSWTLKSSSIYKQINIEAWLEQQAADDDSYSRLSELTSSSTPYIVPRLNLLSKFAKSPELQHWRKMINHFIQQNAPKVSAKPKADVEVVRLKCTGCQNPLQVPMKVLAGKAELPVKCPKCGKITKLKKNIKPAEKASAPKPNKREENMDYDD